MLSPLGIALVAIVELDAPPYSESVTVYVDDMYLYPLGQYRGMKMSHMIADTDDAIVIKHQDAR